MTISYTIQANATTGNGSSAIARTGSSREKIRHHRVERFRKINIAPGDRRRHTLHNKAALNTRMRDFEGSIKEPSQAIEETGHYTYPRHLRSLELIEEMTATEMLEFHGKFKRFILRFPIAIILQGGGIGEAT